MPDFDVLFTARHGHDFCEYVNSADVLEISAAVCGGLGAESMDAAIAAWSKLSDELRVIYQAYQNKIKKYQNFDWVKARTYSSA